MEFDVTRLTKPKWGRNGTKPTEYITIYDLRGINNSYMEKGGKIYWKQ